MGNDGQVVRVGDTVRRPAGPQTAAVSVLLDALAPTTFEAPKHLGAGPSGEQVLGWIEGHVAVPPFARWAMSDTALASTARLLRSYHDAVAGLAFPPDLPWSREMADPSGGPIICHNDVCPENVVFRDGEAVALIDFDFAAWGRPLWDLAQMARMWAPLRPCDLRVAGMEQLDHLLRLATLAGAYGVPRTAHCVFIDAILDSADAARGFVIRRLERHEPAFVAAWEPIGGVAACARIYDWIVGQHDAMLSALDRG